MATGWQEYKGKWYYLYSNGQMAASQWIKSSDGSWYYLNDDGKMEKGWQEYTEGKWYYLDPKGKMQTGSQNIDGKEYYLYSDGEMAADQWVKNTDGSWCYQLIVKCRKAERI